MARNWVGHGRYGLQIWVSSRGQSTGGVPLVLRVGRRAETVCRKKSACIATLHKASETDVFFGRTCGEKTLIIKT